MLALVACTTEDGVIEDEGADLAGQDEKGDAVPGIEVQGRLAVGTADTRLTTRVPRPGFVFYAAAGAKVTLEVTKAGSSAGLDTAIKVYGPRLADGSYPRTIGADDDAGYGKLSKISALAIDIGGFYLVEVTNGAAASAPAADAKARLKLSCSGSCTTDQPVAPLGLDIKWYQRSAERRALSLQAYGAATAKVSARVAAGAPASWGVVLDIDETSLDNSPYQRARGELGLGYSPASWGDWVDQRAAEPIPGALAFTRTVMQLGGHVVFVSNRLASTECPATEQNLTAKGFVFDAMLCKTNTSDKNPRFASIAAGTARPGMPPLEILAFVGDNILDFPALSQELRTKPESAYADFGEKMFLIPNPMYGSWEKNTD
ncbi:MAG: 5'-nucleotidase, lipoprotein e(P4) family [Kofleriaceae bacterium]